MDGEVTGKNTKSNSNNLSIIDEAITKEKYIGLLKLSKSDISFMNYNSEKYIQHISALGLETTWAHILNHVRLNGCDSFLNLNNFGEMYEAGLAEQDKKLKKKSGQYFTPTDVSRLMAYWLSELNGENVCDVGCGTGNLVLAYLDLIGKEKAKKLLNDKKIYLYDFDKTAITIAQYSIAISYGFEYLDKINIVYGDFLSRKIKLPHNSKIISNPPYAKFDLMQDTWDKTKIQSATKELYAAFMEKIVLSKNTAVIITPYSYLGGSKFQDLRNTLSNYNGFIVAFDNVPGNIFNGRKHGIFNTNTANSVRAAITVVENNDHKKGFRTTHLIRFKNEERKILLNPSLLKNLLSKNYQTTNSLSKMFARCHVELENCFNNWISKSTATIDDYVSKTQNEYTMYMPNTCRYFTTASKRCLSRGGYITLSVENSDKFNYLYCLINSSFVYWWWRIYDGGITYPKSLLGSLPIFYDLLTDDDKKYFAIVTKEMVSKEESYLIRKLNAGKTQENIKFPKKYRDEINNRMLSILACDIKPSTFDLVHANSFISIEGDNTNER